MTDDVTKGVTEDVMQDGSTDGITDESIVIMSTDSSMGDDSTMGYENRVTPSMESTEDIDDAVVKTTPEFYEVTDEGVTEQPDSAMHTAGESGTAVTEDATNVRAGSDETTEYDQDPSPAETMTTEATGHMIVSDETTDDGVLTAGQATAEEPVTQTEATDEMKETTLATATAEPTAKASPDMSETEQPLTDLETRSTPTSRVETEATTRRLVGGCAGTRFVLFTVQFKTKKVSAGYTLLDRKIVASGMLAVKLAPRFVVVMFVN